LGFVISVHLIVNLILSCNMVHMPFRYISGQTPYRGQSEIATFVSSPFCTQLWELQPVAFQLSKMADLQGMTNNPWRHVFTLPSASEVVGSTGLYEVR